MYYLLIRNLGIEKCIDRNEEDIYKEGEYYSFLPEYFFVKTNFVRQLRIRCTELPGTIADAAVYSD
jgi:hypothetical protein